MSLESAQRSRGTDDKWKILPSIHGCSNWSVADGAESSIDT